MSIIRDELFEDFFSSLPGIRLLGPTHRNCERISRKTTWDAAWKACLESDNHVPPFITRKTGEYLFDHESRIKALEAEVENIKKISILPYFQGATNG